MTSAPDVTALRIGGPGSGGSAKFRGDLAELCVYDTPLSAADRDKCEAELRERWMGAGNQAAADDPIEDSLRRGSSRLRGPFWADAAERDRVLPDETRDRLAAMTKELESLEKKPAQEIPRAVVVQDGGPPNTLHAGFGDAAVNIRGNPANPGQSAARFSTRAGRPAAHDSRRKRPP